MNTARMFISLKPPEQRKISADLVIARLRPKLARVPGATLYMQASQDVRVGGRFGAAQYQFTMRGDNLRDLQTFGPRMLQELRTIPIIADVNTDQQDRGLQAFVQYDRATAARFGISPQLIDNTLYDAFGERQVSTMYTPLNQYHVVMEVAPEFWQNPLFLRQIYVRSPSGQEVPLSAFTKYAPITAPLVGEPPGPLTFGDHLVQSPAGRRVGRCRGRHYRKGRQDWLARDHSHGFRRNRASLSGFAGQRAPADRRRAHFGLPGARDPLRKLCSSRHHSLHAAVGGRGRAAGADAHAYRTHGDRHHRNHSADWTL